MSQQLRPLPVGKTLEQVIKETDPQDKGHLECDLVHEPCMGPARLHKDTDYVAVCPNCNEAGDAFSKDFIKEED